MTPEERISLFCAKIVRSGAAVKVVTNPEELHLVLSELLQGADSVYCPGVSDLEKTIRIDSGIRKADYLEAKTTVEEVAAGIAETGTIVCMSTPGKALQASLVPYHHIGIISRENIFDDLDEFFARITDPLPTNVTFVTGPSRTGDIELTLSTGVHGPGRIDIIIY